MLDPIKASWCLNDNFGDKLTPWFIKRITGQYPIYLEPGVNEGQKLLGIGSILNWNWVKNEQLIVWGSGIANIKDHIEKADFRLVRGPICVDRVKQLYNADVPYGDPGLLLSRFINEEVIKTEDIGIIAHYTDQNIIWKKILNQTGIRFINILKSVEEIVQDVRNCKFVFSSSLHGLIVCDAYHIPNFWIKVSNNVIGDDTKFRDYFLSVNRSYDYLDCRETEIPFNEIQKFSDLYSIGCIKDSIEKRKEVIWETCPFKDGILK